MKPSRFTILFAVSSSFILGGCASGKPYPHAVAAKSPEVREVELRRTVTELIRAGEHQKKLARKMVRDTLTR